ncbi:N-acetyltransferase [Sphingobium sp. 3R8]|uniref:GNAT family N-acetyltransferase n=1 Tax=Sphingobium sp. 3R8 TaxID=2874921 RepID=UPI001CCF1D1F|nr:GNAT family N-acetyltransferase [Sphingobium sp. 3R8]MBZ9650038.1 N-acetyltransferase [Sphingobium sp. 3R8]
MMADTGNVRNNEAEGRYELAVDGQLAIAAYDRREGALVFTHTQVPEALEGQGVGSRLVKAALADARAQNLKVVPLCEFVAAYIERHPQEQDLLALDAPG